MNQTDRRLFLIKELLRERPEYSEVEIPRQEQPQKRLLRSLFNLRMSLPVSQEFLKIQDAYLQQEAKQKAIVGLADLKPVRPGVYLWQGDITRLRVDAIVNAANSALLGCFCPCHGCVDNAIHSAAGMQLRQECSRLMQAQGRPEPAGRAKLTSGYNLPAGYVLHTVGPVVTGEVTRQNREELASCYRSCLELAAQNGFSSLAFCCISTGEFHFPHEEAARIAVETVTRFLQTSTSLLRVIFNVFKDIDAALYRRLLGAD